MIHRGDFHLSRRQLLDRVIGAVMAVVHLDGLAAQGQRKHLMAKANAKRRHIICK